MMALITCSSGRFQQAQVVQHLLQADAVGIVVLPVIVVSSLSPFRMAFFVSDSLLVFLYGFTCTCFPEVQVHGRLEVWNSPQLPPRSGGDMAMAAPHRCSFLTPYIRCCPIVPCIVAAHGAPGHNRWGVVERRLPVKTQGRNAGCILTLPTKYCCSVWVLSVAAKSQQGPTVTSVVRSPVLDVRRHSKASDALREHRRVPLAQRGRMSSLVRDMLTR